MKFKTMQQFELFELFDDTCEYRLQHIEGIKQIIQIRIMMINARLFPDCKEGFNGWHVAKYLKYCLCKFMILYRYYLDLKEMIMLHENI